MKCPGSNLDSLCITERNQDIDILRFVAITCIIIAHSQPDMIIMQLRNFDVPLMVVLSGICYRPTSLIPYYWKRIKRLVFPCWIFLPLWFLAKYINQNPLPNASEIVKLFTFSFSELTFLWIIRIFLFIALVSPLLYFFSYKLTSKSFFTIAGSWFLINECLARSCTSFWGEYLLMCITYSIFAMYGMRLKHLSMYHIKMICVMGGGLFSILAVFLYCRYGEFVGTQVFKYPPTMYYISYAIFFVCFVYLVRSYVFQLFRYLGLLKICLFIGSHTLWIYFWHIIILEFQNGNYDSLYTFAVVYFFSVIITFLQSRFFSRIVDKFADENIRKNLLMIFCG